MMPHYTGGAVMVRWWCGGGAVVVQWRAR